MRFCLFLLLALLITGCAGVRTSGNFGSGVYEEETKITVNGGILSTTPRGDSNQWNQDSGEVTINKKKKTNSYGISISN